MTQARTVNEIPSGVGVDGKPDSVHPGGLDACRWHCSPAARCPRSPPPVTRHGAISRRYPSSTGAHPRARDNRPRSPRVPRRRERPPCFPPPAATLLLLRAGAIPALCSGVRIRARDGSFAVTAGELGNGDRVRQWLPPPPRPTPARASGQPWNNASASNDFRFHKNSCYSSPKYPY
jgi:hypothetical protein